jgi:ferredoxin-type protein NapH
MQPEPPFFLWRHLNKLRWVSLCVVFSMLVFLPFAHVYQTFVAAHAYDLLAPSEQKLYDVMEVLTQPIVSDPARELDVIKGTTWSGTFWGYKISDPLAVVGQTAASLSVYWPFALTALIPIILTVIFGRFFCGWICPATLLYELNTNFGAWLRWAGLHVGNRHLDKRLKYAVLGLGIIVSAASGSVLVATIYPPAIIGRELYYGIAWGGFGAGMVFFLITLLFDLLVARRGFCRYVCPGGALYSLLGWFRLVRIKRIVESCNDCAKCNAVCEFGLDPLHDKFGQECNNCTACIAICPVQAMTFTIRPTDIPEQGPGHEGHQFKGRKTDVAQPGDNVKNKSPEKVT